MSNANFVGGEIVLKSPNGDDWKLGVSDEGETTWTNLSTEEPPEDPTETVLFFDDFNRADTTTGLGTPVVGNAYPSTTAWRVYDGKMTAVDANGHNDIGIHNIVNVANYEISFDVITPSLNALTIGWRNDTKYGMNIKIFSDKLWLRKGDNEPDILDAYNGTVPNGAHIRIRVDGDNHKVFMNGTLICEATNSLAPHPYAMFIGQYKDEAKIDNFKIVALS